MISAKVIADSYNPDNGGNRLTTLQLCYPRLIHSELMTHRAFCLSGGAMLEFDLPAKVRGRRRVHRMSVAEFVDKWMNGAAEGRASRFNGATLEGVDLCADYSADEIRRLLGHKTRMNLNEACRSGAVVGARKVSGEWVATGKAWADWRRPAGARRFSLRGRLEKMRLRQVNEDTGSVQHTTVTDCVVSGEKEVFRLCAGGFSVAASKDHRILTARGWLPLGEVEPGIDSICVYRYGTGGNPDPYKKIGGQWVDSWSRKVKPLVKARQGGLCAHTGVELGEVYDLHHVIPRHVDQSKAFDLDNVVALTPEAHRSAHADQGWQEGVPLGSQFALVSSIESEGVEITYDLEVAGPFHNFFADGVVVHNSRNASSSRAIPVAKVIAQVRENPAMPVHWGANKPGMQASAEVDDIEHAKHLWLLAAQAAANSAESMMERGLHKQVANRVLEPFQWMHTILSATEFDNFFALRLHPDADPNIYALAKVMVEAIKSSTPVYLGYGQWHLPYVTEDEQDLPLGQRKMVSAARCARVSYLTHDGQKPEVEKDLALFHRLAGGRPIHASPLEHQATPSARGWANFRGWQQFRAEVEAGL